MTKIMIIIFVPFMISFPFTKGGGLVQFDGHCEKGSLVVLCGALDVGQLLAEHAPLSGHCVVSGILSRIERRLNNNK